MAVVLLLSSGYHMDMKIAMNNSAFLLSLTLSELKSYRFSELLYLFYLQLTTD
jgi:hypothetical protein